MADGSVKSPVCAECEAKERQVKNLLALQERNKVVVDRMQAGSALMIPAAFGVIKTIQTYREALESIAENGSGVAAEKAKAALAAVPRDS